ncbi:MAG TPA: alpha/beta fold hydrolase [Burkholderiales bacterium]|nr:alpha/beta fold hydrolase [Burkholderiales bacterium]
MGAIEKLRAPVKKDPPSAPVPEDIDAAAAMAFGVDRVLRAYASRATFGISPGAVAIAFFDWWQHLATSPGKQLELGRKVFRKWLRFSDFLARAARGEKTAPCIEPLAGDSRFAAEAWNAWPFDAMYQGFLLTQQWWHNATTDVKGVAPHHAALVNFVTRQMLDMWAPSNLAWTNPEVLRVTREQGGKNLVRGISNFMEDWRRIALGQPPVGAEAFLPGKQVARTPGKVVFRNRLMELIQYAPATDTVFAEPLLVVPAWIMKYYILDLSPHNSLVEYLVERGHSVFMISWKNPGPSDRDLSLADYRRLGIEDALAAIGRIAPERRVHAVGYCLGGTLLAIAAAAMARNGDARLATVTLLASQVDFAEAGELGLFIDESEVALLEDMMAEQGFLDPGQMSGAFQLLRSNDLIWSQRITEYLLGERPPMTDLMAWNADGTRMPCRMHSEYLRRLYLHNDLSAGRYHVDGRPVALRDIRAPLFAVGTEKDHVAPWRSVYKLNLYTDSEVTFLLASGGHNVGIVSDPAYAGSSYQVATRGRDEPYIDPDAWARQAPRSQGSWWPEWTRWLAQHSGARTAPPEMGCAAAGYPVLDDAPGQYVHMK